MNLKDFIVNVLGCGCPEEIFSSIDLERSPDAGGSIPLLFRIGVGGRLLILGVSGDTLLTTADGLANLVESGARLRDEKGFNRLRIVAVSDDPACEAGLRQRFEAIPGAGDRIHLHVVKEKVVKDMLAGSSACMERGRKMEKLKTEPTVWHEMEGPFIGGREHYQEKSYGFAPLREAEVRAEEKPDPEEKEK